MQDAPNSKAWHEALIEQFEDMSDRLSIYEREGLTMNYDKLSKELGLDDA